MNPKTLTPVRGFPGSFGSATTPGSYLWAFFFMFVIKQSPGDEITLDRVPAGVFIDVLTGGRNAAIILDRDQWNEIKKYGDSCFKKTRKPREIVKHDVIMPFDSPAFADAWELWKKYKRAEFSGFQYKSFISEQGAVKKLSEIANGQEDIAIKIILQSIENRWSGHHPLKQQNERREERKTATLDGLAEKLNRRFNK